MTTLIDSTSLGVYYVPDAPTLDSHGVIEAVSLGVYYVPDAPTLDSHGVIEAVSLGVEHPADELPPMASVSISNVIR